ncbi:MAG TPA: cupin [Gammaproteobacteria bacterium]|nr:cupin [Gammaproteobacteria bacterium]
MSRLAIFDEGGRLLESEADAARISARLDGVGVLFERWEAEEKLAAGAGQDDILAAYRRPVDRLKRHYGFQAADVISLSADHPGKAALRQKFLDEHTHSEFEVRFFVAGGGLFYIHAGDKVYAVYCRQGDLISVPARMPHWFDMGEQPELTCIRLFTNPEGWVAHYTGSDIARRLPTLDAFLAGQP